MQKAENANYDIGKAKEGESAPTEESTGFQLNLKSYEITNAYISYVDRASGMQLELSDIQHKGTGDLSLETTELQTRTNALVSFGIDSTNYLNRNKVTLDALISVDLRENKYSFLKNEAVVNQLPLVFDGFVKVNEGSQEVDISFKTPSSDFKNFLAVVPVEYSKNIENVKTTGNFEVQGQFTGIVDGEHIPKFNIQVLSDNASFKYPDLPKSVRNVHIDTKINNTTGIAQDTYIDVDRLTFMIDEDRFNMIANISELMGNTQVNAKVDGKMNLANISKAYPVPASLDLKGLLHADISTAFDMASIENKQYEKTRTSGMMELRDFEYKSDELPNSISLKSTSLSFDPGTVTLNQLSGTTGQTDFNATGSIDNLLGFMFNDEKVKGDFDLKSDTFVLADFMVEEEPTEGDGASKTGSGTSGERIKIPSFLDANINASANTVVYDNLTLREVKGNLRIQDEKAVLGNMTSSMFDGKVSFNGEVSTKGETTTFAMKLGLDKLEIGETFKTMKLFKVLAPIAQMLQGKLDSDIELSGNLTDDLSPDLLSLSGNLLANIFTREVSTNETPLLSALDSELDFIDVKQLNLDELKTKLSFKDGVVSVKPFTIKYKDVAINVDGGHTFDQKLDYTATMEVPAKYLGKDINDLIAKIDDESLENLTIPVTANIGGVYSSPAVTTDFASGAKNLTAQLIAVQKQKLIAQGTDKAKDLISGVLRGNSDKSDSGEQQDPEEQDIKEALGGLLGDAGEKSPSQDKTDSLAPQKKEEDVVTEKAKDILGGLLGRKKKDSPKSEKDSVN